MKRNENRTVLVVPEESVSKTKLVNLEDVVEHDISNKNRDVFEYDEVLNEENPFLVYTRGLFRETYVVMNLKENSDIESVNKSLRQEMDNFSENLSNYGGDSRYLKLARYMMCTFCDELIANSSWASSRDWAGVGLLNHYHKESYGGDKFFQILDKFMDNPSEHVNLLELAFVCLSFGFGGRYKEQNKTEELNILKENLYKQIKNISSRKERFYVDHPSAIRHHKLYSKLSRKVILSTVLVLMVLIYTVFTFMVSSNESLLIETLNEKYEILEKGKHL